MADVPRTESTEDRIGQCMNQDIGVGVAFQALVVGQFNASEKKFTALDEGVDVITNANAIHKLSTMPESAPSTTRF